MITTHVSIPTVDGDMDLLTIAEFPIRPEIGDVITLDWQTLDVNEQAHPEAEAWRVGSAGLNIEVVDNKNWLQIQSEDSKYTQMVLSLDCKVCEFPKDVAAT